MRNAPLLLVLPPERRALDLLFVVIVEHVRVEHIVLCPLHVEIDIDALVPVVRMALSFHSLVGRWVGAWVVPVPHNALPVRARAVRESGGGEVDFIAAVSFYPSN